MIFSYFPEARQRLRQKENDEHETRSEQNSFDVEILKTKVLADQC